MFKVVNGTTSHYSKLESRKNRKWWNAVVWFKLLPSTRVWISKSSWIKPLSKQSAIVISLSKLFPSSAISRDRRVDKSIGPYSFDYARPDTTCPRRPAQKPTRKHLLNNDAITYSPNCAYIADILHNSFRWKHHCERVRQIHSSRFCWGIRALTVWT